MGSEMCIRDRQWAHSRVIPQLTAHNLAPGDAPLAPALNTFFASALNPDPQQRFATASIMLAELSELASAPRPAAPDAAAGPATLPASPHHERAQQPRRRHLSILGGVLAAVLLCLAVAGGLALYGAGWDEHDEVLAQQFPQLLPEHPGRAPWRNLDCRPALPEAGQQARIVCRSDDLTLVAADFGTEDNRNSIMPRRLDVLVQDACSITSAEIPHQPGTWGVYPSGVSARFALVLAGPQAHEDRLSLPIC